MLDNNKPCWTLYMCVCVFVTMCLFLGHTLASNGTTRADYIRQQLQIKCK
jgi:hypothetical protein